MFKGVPRGFLNILRNLGISSLLVLWPIIALGVAQPHGKNKYALDVIRVESFSPLVNKSWNGPGRVVTQMNGEVNFLGRLDFLETQTTDNLFSKITNIKLAERKARQYFQKVTHSQIADNDLRLVSVEPVDHFLVLNFVQTVQGYPIHNTYATAAVYADGIHFAVHYLVETPHLNLSNTEFSLNKAWQLTHNYLLHYFSHTVISTDIKPIVIFHKGQARLVALLEVKTQEPWEWWRIFVDTNKGEIVGQENLGNNATEGQIKFNIEEVCPDFGNNLLGMPNIQWKSGQYTGNDGKFYSTSSLSQISIELKSPYFNLINMDGELAGPWNKNVSNGWNDVEITNAPFDQVDPFYHANRVRNWAQSRIEDINSQKAWIDSKIDLNINIPEVCNAYYDGNLNFFQEGGACLNTGRVACVVIHEYGHGIHHHSGDPSFGSHSSIQVSEGLADFTASTILNDPNMRGLFGCSHVFRTCVNNLTYCGSGCDISPSTAVHDAGRVLCAAWWEIREQLIERYGYDLGVAITDKLFLRFMTLVRSLDGAYAAAIAADDDDDGNPANGTNHSCEINKAFANDEDGAIAHFPELVGKIPGAPRIIVEHEAPGLKEIGESENPFLEFYINLEAGCAPVEGIVPEIKLHYKTSKGQMGEVLMTENTTTSKGKRYIAELTDLKPRVTIEYYVHIKLASYEFYYPYQGSETKYKNFQGYPHFRQFAHFGVEDTIWFSDFEISDGGTLTSGCIRENDSSPCVDDNQNDWEWGAASNLSGGPSKAKSGTKIWATDLDGVYDKNRISYLELPSFDGTQYGEVRLQFWRQLLNSDVVRIEIDGRRVYEHRSGAFFWRDPFWVFQDFDITEYITGKTNAKIRFMLSDEFSDPFQMGGWHIDDVRIAGVAGSNTGPGNGTEGSSDLEQEITAQGCAGCQQADPDLLLLGIAFLFFGRIRQKISIYLI